MSVTVWISDHPVMSWCHVSWCHDVMMSWCWCHDVMMSLWHRVAKFVWATAQSRSQTLLPRNSAEVQKCCTIFTRPPSPLAVLKGGLGTRLEDSKPWTRAFFCPAATWHWGSTEGLLTPWNLVRFWLKSLEILTEILKSLLKSEIWNLKTLRNLVI